jgi:hypothetical protein
MRVSRPAVRPIVLREEYPGLPIREVGFASVERRLVADCFFVTDIDGSLLPITLPIPRPRSVRSVERLLFTLGVVDDLVELTAGCLAPVGAEELRVPIVLPIRERWLVVGCFFAFEAGGVLRLLEPPIREAPLELAAGWFALLGTDGLVVLILLPIREVILGLILLLVLVVDRFVIVFRDLVLDGLLVLLEEVERLPGCVPGLIELTIRDVMLGLILLLEFLVERFVTTLLELLKFKLLLLERLTLNVLLLEVLLFVIALLELLLLGVRFVTIRLVPLVLGVRVVMLLLGALLVMALLEVLLLGARLVITLLELLLLGARLVIDLLELLLLGARLVIDLLELLLLGARLVTLLLELRLDETLLERLDDDLLDEDLAAEDDLEDDRLDRLLLDLDLAAITGSQNNKRANRVQKTRKREPYRSDLLILTFEF